MVEASQTLAQSGANQMGVSPTFQATSANTRTNPVPPTNNYGNEFESWLISALNDSLIRKSKFQQIQRHNLYL